MGMGIQKWTFPLGGFSCPLFLGRIGIWNEVFLEERKTEGPGDEPSKQGQKAMTNSTFMWSQVQESNPGHSGGEVNALNHHCAIPAPTYNL